MTSKLQSISNYLVPAAGTTRGFVVREIFDPLKPKYIDFREQGLDGAPFRPSGVFIDNSANAEPLTVVINEFSYAVKAKAGEFMCAPYPAPMQQTVSIIGNGEATVVFVDFPVIPFSSAGSGGGGTVTTAWTEGDVSALLADLGDASLDRTAILNILSGISADTDNLLQISTYLQTISGRGLSSVQATSLMNIMQYDIKPDVAAIDTAVRAIRFALCPQDDQGNWIPDDVTCPLEYVYDTNGNMVEEIRYYQDMTGKFTRTHTYDGSNRKIGASMWVYSDVTPAP